MEEEIDLRQYIQVIVRRWKWIVGATLIAAVAALGVSLLIPPTYEATALVAITKPRYILQFDSRFETESNIQPTYKAYPELALSDNVLQALAAKLDQSGAGLQSLANLRGRVEAKAGADPSLVQLMVSSQDKKEAAQIANMWAEVFVSQANELYGAHNAEQTIAFQSQLEQAQADLAASEQALIDFQASNEAAIIKNQLDSSLKSQADYLTMQQGITNTIQDIQGLRRQLAEQPAGRPSDIGDQLTVLFLQIKAFNAQVSVPLQLQIVSTETLAAKNTSEQIAFLNELGNTLKAKSIEINLKLAAIEPQILELQRQLQQAKTEEERLTRARNLAQETYIALARKVAEDRIAAQNTTDEVKVASQAATPEEPVSPRKLLNTAIAGMLGLLVSLVGAIVAEWWYSPATVKENKKT